jgi:AraC-like DNA-binding protein
MSLLELFLCDSACVVRYRGTERQVPAKSVVIAAPGASIVPMHALAVAAYQFQVGDLRGLYADLANHIGVHQGKPFVRDEIKSSVLSDDAFQVACRLASLDRRLLLRFLYSYCVGVEPDYFCGLLAHLMHSSTEFLDFIEENVYCTWTVTEYASALGLTPRNLNMLFQEKYGMSAKHWLLERRLQHARQLLWTTSMKVIDIATECGFKSPAHFSSLFRRRFDLCPRTMRGKLLEAAIGGKHGRELEQH